MRTLTIFFFLICVVQISFAQRVQYISEPKEQRIVPNNVILGSYSLKQNGKAYFEGPQIVSISSEFVFTGWFNMYQQTMKEETTLFSAGENKKNQIKNEYGPEGEPFIPWLLMIGIFVYFIIFMRYIKIREYNAAIITVIVALAVACPSASTVSTSTTYIAAIIVVATNIVALVTVALVTFFIFLFIDTRVFSTKVALVYFTLNSLAFMFISIDLKSPVFLLPALLGLSGGLYLGTKDLKRKNLAVK